MSAIGSQARDTRSWHIFLSIRQPNRAQQADLPVDRSGSLSFFVWAKVSSLDLTKVDRHDPLLSKSGFPEVDPFGPLLPKSGSKWSTFV